MAITSTIIGAGIISVPYAMIVNGIWIGVAINLSVMVFMLFCAYLYMKARDMYQIESFSDLCYMGFGKRSIYVVNCMVALIIFGIMILYLIFFSRICISLFGGKKWIWVIVTTVLLMPFMLKRQINEMKCNSKILFFGILFLIFTFVVK